MPSEEMNALLAEMSGMCEESEESEAEEATSSAPIAAAPDAVPASDSAASHMPGDDKKAGGEKEGAVGAEVGEAPVMVMVNGVAKNFHEVTESDTHLMSKEEQSKYLELMAPDSDGFDDDY